MKYIKPDYYDDFQCIAGACPATCCAGWQVVVDDESLERYRMVEGEFGKRLQNEIDWEEGIFLQNGRRCCFLNENHLCDLQSELGKNFLCETCQSYPRHIEEFEGQREYSLSLSCPVAAELIFANKNNGKFVEWEDEIEEDEFGMMNLLLFTQLEDAREKIYQILNKKEIPFLVRLEMILKLSGAIQKCVNEERFFDVDGVLEHALEYPQECLGVSSYEKKTKYFIVLLKLELLDESWGELLLLTWERLYEKGECEYQKIYNEFQESYGKYSENEKKWEQIGRQLVTFFIYTYFCGAVYDEWIYSKAALAVFSVLMIQEFLMARWLEQGQLTKRDISEVARRYAREVEHSEENLELLEDWLMLQYAGHKK